MSDSSPAPERGRVLLGISGGIAAYKTPFLVRELRRRGLAVRCALTANGARFVSPLALEVVSQQPVHREEYLCGGGQGEEKHVALAQWASACCLAPATANLLSRVAHGIADDFLSTVVTMLERPLVVAPAMHSAMWRKPAIQRAVALLTERGALIVGPDYGALASDEVGPGRLAEAEQIADSVERALTPQSYRGLRVLVTAGPTHEAVDPVRYLANRSSGRMGFALAAEAARRGASVELVCGPVALPTPSAVVRCDVESAVEMSSRVLERAQHSDLVIMAAAVADYRVAELAVQKKKKKKIGQRLRLELIENPDILASLAQAAPRAVRVGFAAETERLVEHAQDKLERKGAHFVVANDVSRSDIGFGSEHNEVTVLRRCGSPLSLPRATKRVLAGQLLDLFLERVQKRSLESVLEPAP